MSIVKLPASTFVDLYAETGITIGVKLVALNLTPNDARLYHSENEPTITDDHIPIIFRSSGSINETGDVGAWAMCVSGGAIDVKEAE